MIERNDGIKILEKDNDMGVFLPDIIDVFNNDIQIIANQLDEIRKTLLDIQR